MGVGNIFSLQFGGLGKVVDFKGGYIEHFTHYSI